PSLYSAEYYRLESDIKDLTTGQLELKAVNEETIEKDEPGIINIPNRIKNIEQFKDLIFTAWENIK
ncbi:MAG: nucleoside hydrolase, partial [Halanaerobacter sp.]